VIRTSLKHIHSISRRFTARPYRNENAIRSHNITSVKPYRVRENTGTPGHPTIAEVARAIRTLWSARLALGTNTVVPEFVRAETWS